MLFIPISIETITQIKNADSVSFLIERLSVSELASLTLIQKLPDSQDDVQSNDELPDLAERFLCDFIKVTDCNVASYVYAHALSCFSLERLLQGINILENCDISLMTCDQVVDEKYLDNEGCWDWGFRKKFGNDFEESIALQGASISNRYVTREQERYLNIILRERDESLDLQGYAGTGKTRIITYLVDAFDEDKLLLLAIFQGQLDAMLSRLNKNPVGKTFAAIAYSILSTNLIGSVQKINGRNNQKYKISYERLAELLSCYPLGAHSAVVVVMEASRAVSVFCASSDDEITLSHIRGKFKDSEHRLTILGIAKNIWDLICIPRDGIKLPIRGYHLIKAMALSEKTIPSHYSHIVVDETHDLTKPMIQILDRSPQAVFTFGDKYQALGGTRSLNNRGSTIRKKQMSHSVRAGNNVSDLYNNIISKHPVAPEVEFNGSKKKKTKIIYYEKFKIPEYYCTILARNNWSIFGLVQRLASASSRFRIIERARGDLKWLIDDAISFYKTGDRPKHFEFSNYNSWGAYVLSKNDPIIYRVDKILKKGYDFTDFDNALNKEVKDSWSNVYIVGRVEDSRNMEFDRVALLDDIPSGARSSSVAKSDQDKSKVVSHIYTGISRAKHELIIPSNLDGWLDEV